MNLKQKEVVRELKEISNKLGHSPTRREISSSLVWKSYKHFGSFNKAKQEAGLDIFSIKNPKINKSSLKKDLDLVRIIAFINFDGHLAKDLKSFYYSSKRLNDVKLFEKIINRKFHVRCKIKENSTGSAKQTHLCWVFNKPLTEKLNELGAVKGDKVICHYILPKWITYNKEFSKEFLKIAFFCEGSNKEEKGRKMRIKFSMHKSEELLRNGIKIINQLKTMLSKFDIKTTPIYISNARTRKDKIKTKLLAFRIKTEDSNKFINEIGWLK